MVQLSTPLLILCLIFSVTVISSLPYAFLQTLHLSISPPFLDIPYSSDTSPFNISQSLPRHTLFFRHFTFQCLLLNSHTHQTTPQAHVTPPLLTTSPLHHLTTSPPPLHLPCTLTSLYTSLRIIG